MSNAGGIGGRLTSWEIIRNEGICKLPVDPLKIAFDNKIAVFTYTELATRNNLELKYYKERYSDSGFCYFLNNRFYIAYDDTLSESQRRYVLMHELSHVFAGDIGPHNHIMEMLAADDYREREAHKMTRRVLCPSIVLHMCGCSSPKEIQALCGVDKQVAEQRFSHLELRRKNREFFKSPIEREVLMDFLDFISDYLCAKKKMV